MYRWDLYALDRICAWPSSKFLNLMDIDHILRTCSGLGVTHTTLFTCAFCAPCQFGLIPNELQFDDASHASDASATQELEFLQSTHTRFCCSILGPMVFVCIFHSQAIDVGKSRTSTNDIGKSRVTFVPPTYSRLIIYE